MTRDQEYEAGCVLPWVNEMFIALGATAVPFNRESVRSTTGISFATPQRLSGLEVAVPDAKFNPLDHRGALRLVSPPEPLHAWWWAVARDVDDESKLQQWATCARSTTIKCVVIAKDFQISLRQENLRDKISQLYAVVKRTADQRIHVVVHSKRQTESARPEDLSDRKFVELYLGSVVESTETEPTTESFVKQALYIHAEALSNDKIRWCVEFLEGEPID